MGITGAHELSHSVKDLSIQDVFNICLFIRQKHQSSTKPTIDLDASLIYRCSKLSIDNRMLQIVDICCQFACVGFEVAVVCDGAVRHHTKRASIQRQSALFSNNVKSYLLRVKLMALVESKTKVTTVLEKETFSNEENAICNEIRAIERKLQHSSVDVGQSFFESLERHVQHIPSADLGKKGGKITVMQAEYQADSVLAYRRVNNISDIVFSSDTDLLAHAGQNSLGIKLYNYILKGRKSGIDNIEVFTSNEEMLGDIVTALRLSPDSKNIKRSRHAIFDGISCPKSRALLAVGLGCDVYKSGVRGVSKVVLKSWLDMQKGDYCNTELLYSKILQFFGDRYSCDNTKTKKMLHSKVLSITDRLKFYENLYILCDAFMFEPCNFVTTSANTVPGNELPIYMHNEKPSSLHKYVKDFAKSDQTIHIHGNDDEVSKCSGVARNHSHEFLTFEGINKCFGCMAICCQYCIFEIQDSENSNNNKYCAKCFMKIKLVPEAEIDDLVPIENMMNKLQKVGIEVQKDENFNVILALYDHFVTRNEVIYDETLLNSCVMPFENSKYFNSEFNLLRFNLKEGGLVIRNSYLGVIRKLEMMSLLAKLVTVKPNPKNKNHAAVPEFLVDCANAARIRGGSRLLERALRHSVDNDQTEIYMADTSLILYKNKLGININTRVRASMKNAHYHVTLSFCESGIIANTCSCKVGCHASERIMCIHVLPVVQQLSVEIFSCLAADFLCYFNQEWGTEFESQIDASQIEHLRHNVLSLMRASNLCDLKDYNINDTVSELLKKFDTGTEKSKRGPGPPINKAKLGPLRYVKFEAPRLTTLKKRQPKTVETVPSQPTVPSPPNDRNKTFEDLPPPEVVPYQHILNVVKFIQQQCGQKENTEFSDCIGYNLLGLRASKSASYFDVLSHDKQSELQKLFDIGNLCYRPPRRRGHVRRIPIPDGINVCLPVTESVSEGESNNNDESESATSSENILNIFDDSASPSIIQADVSESVCDAVPVSDATGPVCKHKRTCCIPMCGNASPTSADLFYRRLPACPPQNNGNMFRPTKKDVRNKAFQTETVVVEIWTYR